MLTILFSIKSPTKGGCKVSRGPYFRCDLSTSDGSEMDECLMTTGRGKTGQSLFMLGRRGFSEASRTIPLTQGQVHSGGVALFTEGLLGYVSLLS